VRQYLFPPAFAFTDVVLTGDSEPDSSDDEMSVEIVDPPRTRPVTRSVSNKRPAADESEQEEVLSSPPRPRAKRARRGTITTGTPYIAAANVSSLTDSHRQN